MSNPPEPFYTNTIESINRIIKQKTGYSTTKWPEFCKVAQELVNEQQGEVEKAVIGIGEHLFCKDFKHLQLSLNKWSTMTKVQRERYLQKLSKFTLREAKVPLKEQSLRGTGPSNVIKVFNLCGKKFNADTCAIYCKACLPKQKIYS